MTKIFVGWNTRGNKRRFLDARRNGWKEEGNAKKKAMPAGCGHGK
jgi:hypothetical protein